MIFESDMIFESAEVRNDIINNLTKIRRAGLNGKPLRSLINYADYLNKKRDKQQYNLFIAFLKKHRNMRKNFNVYKDSTVQWALSSILYYCKFSTLDSITTILYKLKNREEQRRLLSLCAKCFAKNLEFSIFLNDFISADYISDYVNICYADSSKLYAKGVLLAILNIADRNIEYNDEEIKLLTNIFNKCADKKYELIKYAYKASDFENVSRGKKFFLSSLAKLVNEETRELCELLKKYD